MFDKENEHVWGRPKLYPVKYINWVGVSAGGTDTEAWVVVRSFGLASISMASGTWQILERINFELPGDLDL